MFKRITESPLLVRVVPFVIFLVLTFLQGRLGDTSQYWIYLVKTLAGAAMLWLVWPFVQEMRWKLSLESVAAGIAVFIVWVGLEGHYPKLGGESGSWKPFDQWGAASAAGWFYVVVRILGSTLVVPPLEEVFYRSFLYRYIVKPDFENVPLAYAHWKPFLIGAVIFGAVHPSDWLAGFFCACVYQGLVIWRKRLGDAMTAHAITNALLGLWVVWKGAWQFW